MALEVRLIHHQVEVLECRDPGGNGTQPTRHLPVSSTQKAAGLLLVRELSELSKRVLLAPSLLEVLYEQRDRQRAKGYGEKDEDRGSPGRCRKTYHRCPPPRAGARSPRLENSMAPRSIPYALSRSANLGRIPVALNCPRTFSFSPIPWRSKTKMSCMVITSPSMPTISEICNSFRVPSPRRLTCTTTFTALAIC